MIAVLGPCQREILELPAEIRGDLADALARLDAGQSLTMPLSRPMTGIGPGVFELRLKDRSGGYRVIYAIVRQRHIYVLHAFKKTTQATSKRDIGVAKKRFQEIDQ